MFKLFKRLFPPKNPSGATWRRDMAAKLNGRHIKYVTERRESGEWVIGREGALVVREGELLVFSSADIVFRADVEKLSMSELLSLEGVILTGPDNTRGGEERTVIAYYTYYIK